MEWRKNRPEKRNRGGFIRKERWIYYGAVLVLMTALSWIFFESVFFGLFFLPLAWFAEGVAHTQVKKRRQRKQEKQFARYLEELDSNLRLGYSLEKSTLEALKKQDFQAEWMGRELEMNVYVLEVFEHLAQKTGLESIRQFSAVLQAVAGSGGNFHEVMRHSIQQIQKKQNVEEKIQSLLTKAKYESRLLILFVPLLLLYMKTLSPNFRKVMYHSLSGKVVMMVSLVLYLFASYLCYAMTEVEL